MKVAHQPLFNAAKAMSPEQIRKIAGGALADLPDDELLRVSAALKSIGDKFVNMLVR